MAVADAGVDRPLPVEVAGSSRVDPRGAARILAAARWSDVVVSFGSSSLSIGSVAARVTNRPFVYRSIGDPSVWGEVRWSDLRVGAPARSARRVIALYPGAAETLVRRYRLDESAIRIIPRGVPEDRFQPADAAQRAAARSELGLDPALSWIAYVGALSAEKDPILALEALELTDETVGIVMAGHGPLAPDVARRADPHGDRVRLLGAVEDVRPVYAASDALVLPSRTEGIPGAAIEAGLSGIPVIAFDVGGVSSVVLDGRTGRVLTDRDPAALAAGMADALSDRTALGSNALRHCLDHFSMRVVANAWQDVIAEAVDAGL